MLVKLKQDFIGSSAGKVMEVSDADAKTLIEKGIAAPAGDDAVSPVIAKAMEAAMTKVSESMNLIVETTLKRFAEAQEGARKLAIPAIFGNGGSGDPQKNFGDWLRHAVIACTGKGKEMANAADYLEKNCKDGFTYPAKAALGESSGVTGGYTVPTQFSEQIQSVMAEDTFIRPRAFVQPMTSAVMQIPYLDITTPQAAGVSAFFGGMQAAWTAEAQSRTEYEPQFKQFELRPWELSAYSVSSNVLLQDSAIGMEKFLYQLFAKVIGWTEEYAFLQGNGTGKPLGMISSPAYIAVTRANPGKISYADVASCHSRLLPSSLQRAIWKSGDFLMPPCSRRTIPLLVVQVAF